MHKIILLKIKQPWMILMFCGLMFVPGTPLLAGTLLINIDTLADTGMIEVQVYHSANAFVTHRNSFRKVTYQLDDPAPYKVENLPAGEYAVLVYLDENGNRQLDRNFVGIPIEPVGFSNRYVPRGPPGFLKAMFPLKQDENREINISLRKPLGKSAQIGVGLGALVSSSPYREYTGSMNRLIPTLTYIGERLQIFGPRFQFGLISGDSVRMALVGQYRFGAYEEDASPLLVGMGDRDNTVFAGLALQLELPAQIDLQLSYQYDILDRIGGNVAGLRFSRKLQFGNLSLTPKIGFNYLSSDVSNYEFGVTDQQVIPGRPAYTLDSTTSVEAGAGVFIELNRDWLLLIDVKIEKFDDEIVDSPIVGEDSLIKGFATINYVF